MKKFISLLICFILVFSLVSCDDEGGKKAVIDEKLWNKAIELANFDNVTIKMKVVMEEEGEFVMKLDGNKAELDGEYNDDAAVVEGIKNIYVGTSLAMVKSFSNFVFDKEKGVFAASEAIEYDVTVQGYDAHITADNVKVKLDTKNLITEIDCDMKQEFKAGDQDKVLELHVTFVFSDYGKTVVKP